MSFSEHWTTFGKMVRQLKNRYVVKKKPVESVEHTVILSLTIPFSLLSDKKYGAILNKV